MPVPLKFFCPAIIQIQSSSFRSNPELPFFSFNNSPYNGRTKSLTFILRQFIMSIYLIIGIKIVDSSEISTYPKGSLMIFENTEYGRITQAAGSIRSSKMSKDSGFLIQFIQSPFSTYPKIPLIIFTNITDGIVSNTVYTSRLPLIMGYLPIPGNTV